jgi:phosphate transport system substrate-binding protein
MKIKITLFIAALAMAALLPSCDIAPSKEKSGSSSGKLKIGVDDSYSLLMDAEIFLYTSLNTNSVIEPTYLPEVEVMDLLLKDSIQAAVVSRALNEQEMNYFKSIQRSPVSTVIAIDGLALIVHPENKDTTITMEQLRNIFDGTDSLWSQINPSKTNKLQIVFDNYKSCNARFLHEKFGLEQFPSYCFALNNNDEVINYVNQNKNAIGVISVSWLNGEDEPVSKKYRRMVKTMGIIDKTNSIDPNMARTPHQAYIFDGTYPLRRDVYYIRTGLRSTLGTGFGYYLENDKGQLLIQKMGMIAAKTPQRLVKLTD